MLALGNHFGLVAAITFLLGITAATYASSDSALTALTTSFCIDFLNIEQYPEAQRQRLKTLVHAGFSLLFLVVIILFGKLNNQAMIRTIFDLAGYTYGPLLGLYAYGLYTRRGVHDRLVPLVCVLSPLLTYLVVSNAPQWLGYSFGFEKLLLNGLLTFTGLLLIGTRREPVVV